MFFGKSTVNTNLFLDIHTAQFLGIYIVLGHMIDNCMYQNHNLESNQCKNSSVQLLSPTDSHP